MDLDAVDVRTFDVRLPRVSGDGPVLETAAFNNATTAPRERGWTVLIEEMPDVEDDCPA